jgi:hypothetical protein
MIFAVPGKKVVYSKGLGMNENLPGKVPDSFLKLATTSSLISNLQKPSDELSGVILDNKTLHMSARPYFPAVMPSKGVSFLR